MMRRLLGLKLLILLLLGLQGCVPSTSVKRDCPVNHVVLVWFNQGLPEGHLERVMAESRKLAVIDGVCSVAVGRAIPSERKIVDSSFDLGLHLAFESEAAMRRYLRDDRHITLVNTWVKPYLARLQVYDF